eukprot:COSAG06_NODE_6018_length_3149_cov_13.874692_2_plen_212_part_00
MERSRSPSRGGSRGSRGQLSPRQRQLRSDFAAAIDGASRATSHRTTELRQRRVEQREAVASSRRRLPVRHTSSLSEPASPREALTHSCVSMTAGGAQRVRACCDGSDGLPPWLSRVAAPCNPLHCRFVKLGRRGCHHNLVVLRPGRARAVAAESAAHYLTNAEVRARALCGVGRAARRRRAGASPAPPCLSSLSLSLVPFAPTRKVAQLAC